ncbi:hypothetical protein [Endozoicomonas sp. 8E]|uniref:hypothetical protein n=1 Tax=Endozoicomonas sp. 8E TaxID=3035692 RepID=UPI002939472A|nr:hypothetical protein [Endozoicomonas sp. 8E]WOG28567.1 hypothetical protein P6910_02620 [Endozoicomonas sp. 8E]
MRLLILPMIVSLILITCPVSASVPNEEILKNKLSAALAVYNLAPQLAETFISEIMGFFKIDPDQFTLFLQDACGLVIGYGINSQEEVTVISVGTAPAGMAGQILIASAEG